MILYLRKGKEKEKKSRQNPRRQTRRRHTARPRITTHQRDRDIRIVAKRILNHHCNRPVRIQTGYCLDPIAIAIRRAPVRLQDARAPRYEAAELRHEVVRRAKREVNVTPVAVAGTASGVDSYHASTIRTTACKMRPGIFIGAQRPRHHAAGPVLQRAHGEIDRVRPRNIRRRPAFAHVLADVGVLVVKVGQHSPVQTARVAMPGDAVDKAVCVFEYGPGIIHII